MKHRFTIAELEGMTDNGILRRICRDRRQGCTNINSPLSKKLTQLIHGLTAKIIEAEQARVKEEEGDGNKHTEICSHDISYFFRDTDLKIDEEGFRHIQDQLCEGYVEGDLNITDPDTDETFHGFWHIERSK